MYNTVIKNSELEQWRSLSETKDFIEHVFSRISKNYELERIPYRLSQGNYKRFSEDLFSGDTGLLEDTFEQPF